MVLRRTFVMQTANELSIEELREESERNREALASTVTELRERVGDTASELKTLVSPSHIKSEIRDYVRQERETLVDSLQRKAKENPLQMAAIGAAVAFPALGLLRAIPAPLWLIGAGLFLTSKRGQQAASDVKTRVDDVVRQGTEQVSELASSLQSDVEDRVAGARYGLEEARDSVSSAVGAVTDKTRAAFHDVRNAVADASQEAGGEVRATAAEFGQRATQTARSMKESTVEAAANSRTTVANFVNDNPILVAGIAVVAGAFIAASIPPSDAENKLFGSGREKLKGKALEAAAQGIEKAGDFAVEAAGAMAAAAAREGLDASGVKGALDKVADSVRAVADRGLETALGEGSSKPSNAGQSQHDPINERNPS
jgi:ElaB/YqjD/DUF883 family membrane-anchored ribosome-binding protein